MADSGKHSLPNLKICIENDEEEAETDNDEISFSDKDDYSFIDEPYSHRVEFSVRLNNNETQEKFETKKYGNKDGTFVTGIDITQKEEAEKREERARRFGLEDTDEQQQPVDLAALYSSLGIREEDVPKNERGIRLEVVHMRGVKNMSTKDIFEYFQEFPPASVEWIEDNSCNVVWSDSLTPARALNKLSVSQESMSARVGKSLADVSERKPTTESSANEEMDENSNNVVAPSVAATSQDDDGSVLNLEDEEATTHSEPMEMNEQPPEPKSDGELSSSEDEEPDKEENTDKKDCGVKSIDLITFEPQDIQWPPGKWRFGKSCLLANQLFMRYATKADRKLPGAEKRSRYYLKYGNPNYGGMRGLISNSRKRKIRSVKSKDDTSNSRDEDAASMDNQRRKNSSQLDGSGASDSSGCDSCSEPEHASHVVSPAPPAKQRMMRMYADDIEEELKAKRSGRQSVAHRMGIGHYGGGHVKDARELLSRSDGIHRHLTNHHQYHRSRDDEEEEEEEEEEDGGRSGNTMSSQYHVIKSDLRAKLERKRMQSSSSSSASLSSASGHYPRLKIEVLD